MEHPQEKLMIHQHDKAKWKPDGNHNIRFFTEDKIKKITRNYITPVGSGGFGQVYTGVLDDDDDHYLVAVKRYIRPDLEDDFVKEVSIHSQINHKNVVKLIGYCVGKSTLAIVTEYISKGNLDDALHNSRISIPLDIRLGIAIGCAEALSYMHSMHLSCGNSLVYHGDIKPANILLDDNLSAKVSDFGLSRLLLGGNTQNTSNVIGSRNYMDPMYQREGRLTPKSDVYSFGAVLLELIARRRVIEGNISLIGTFCKPKGKVSRELFDAEITNESSVKILKEIARLADECLCTDHIDKRPKMNDVVERLRTLWRCVRGEQDIGWYEKSSAMFKKILKSRHSWLQQYLENVRILTMEELKQMTKNFLVPFSWQPEVYKGVLEDNTVVVVVRRFSSDFDFVGKGLRRADIDHKNIIKLVGCCLEEDSPIFIYEYATKGPLSVILNKKEDFPLELRMKIAIGTAKALEYLHSIKACNINVAPSNIFLNDDFVPKLTIGFSMARRIMQEDEELPSIKRDVMIFGGVLLALIMRKNFIADKYDPNRILQGYKKGVGREVFDQDITAQFAKAYKTYNSGRAFFDKDITAEEEIIVLEELGRLAMECIIFGEYGKSDRLSRKAMEFHRRNEKTAVMSEVVQNLQMIKTSWKNKCMGKGATQVTGTVTPDGI